MLKKLGSILSASRNIYSFKNAERDFLTELSRAKENDIFLLFDHNYQLVFSTHKIKNKDLRGFDVENICNNLELSKNTIQSILASLKKRENSVLEDVILHYKPIFGTTFCLHISAETPLNQIANILIDINGKIIKANDAFLLLLGYNKEEITNLEINSLITNSTDKNTLGDYKSYKNWDGILYISGKYDEEHKVFCIQRILKNSSYVSCYFTKLFGDIITENKKEIDLIWGVISGLLREPCFLVTKSDNFIQYSLIFRENNINTELCKQRIRKLIQKMAEHEDKYKVHKNFLESDGIVMDVEISNLDNHHEHFLCILKKSMDTKLLHTDRIQTIGYLAGSIAHDFNNILTAILGFCDILLQKDINQILSDDVVQIKQSAIRGANLVSKLLALARKQTLKTKVINPNEIFSELYPVIKRLVENVIIKQNIAPDLSHIKVDPVQFEQVILNLLVNAQQAITNNGIIEINVYNIDLENENPFQDFIAPLDSGKPKKGKYVAVETKDNGMGIDSKDINRIFEPFFTTKHETSGTGLGLAAVLGIIKQSNGYLLLKSELGRGSTFLILFKSTSEKSEYIAPKQVEFKSLSGEKSYCTCRR